MYIRQLKSDVEHWQIQHWIESRVNCKVYKIKLWSPPKWSDKTSAFVTIDDPQKVQWCTQELHNWMNSRLAQVYIMFCACMCDCSLSLHFFCVCIKLNHVHTPTQTSICRLLNAQDNAPIIVAAATPHGMKATWLSTSLCLLSLCVLLFLLSFFCCFCCSAFVHQLSFRSCVCTQKMHLCLYIFSCLYRAHTYRHTHICTHVCTQLRMHNLADQGITSAEEDP